MGEKIARAEQREAAASQQLVAGRIEKCHKILVQEVQNGHDMSEACLKWLENRMQNKKTGCGPKVDSPGAKKKQKSAAWGL